MAQLPRLAVCGAGNAGVAIAADSALAGLSVSLFELPDFAPSIAPIVEQGGIFVSPGSETCSGKTGLARLAAASTSAAEALAGADVVMITAPAMHHTVFWDAVAPHLAPGQIVLFNTGYFGCLRHAVRMRQRPVGVVLAESNIMPYLCAKSGGAIHITRYKRSFRVAAFPGQAGPKVHNILRRIYPQYELVDHVLDTNIASSGNPAFHPTIILPVAGFYFDRYQGGKMYSDVTVQAGRLIAAFDRDREALARRLGSRFFETTAAFESKVYEYTGADIVEMLKRSNHIDWFAPAAYIRQVVEEDLLYAYVPMALLAEQLGLKLTAIRAMVDILGIMLGEDYWAKGASPAQLGVAGMDRDRLLRYVMEGAS
jgi:opine dehydrogenase